MSTFIYLELMRWIGLLHISLCHSYRFDYKRKNPPFIEGFFSMRVEVPELAS